MVSTTWKDQAHRLKPFNGDLIPVFDAGQRISGKIKDHNFNVDQILDFSNLKAIELRTSLELMCIDFDSEKAFLFAEKRGFCIKREAFIQLIAESLDTPLLKSGRSIGISSEKLRI